MFRTVFSYMTLFDLVFITKTIADFIELNTNILRCKFIHRKRPFWNTVTLSSILLNYPVTRNCPYGQLKPIKFLPHRQRKKSQIPSENFYVVYTHLIIKHFIEHSIAFRPYCVCGSTYINFGSEIYMEHIPHKNNRLNTGLLCMFYYYFTPFVLVDWVTSHCGN